MRRPFTGRMNFEDAWMFAIRNAFLHEMSSGGAAALGSNFYDSPSENAVHDPELPATGQEIRERRQARAIARACPEVSSASA